MKEKLLFCILIVAAVAAPFILKAGKRFMYCNYTSGWYTDPCEPYHGCSNPAMFPYDKCLAHWGIPDVPRPEGCE